MGPKKSKSGKRKEMIIVLKSKPHGSVSIRSNITGLKSSPKPRDVRKKGTRGPSWIG